MGVTKMPVDFWLIDSRSYPYVLSTEFQDAFPDKALMKGQYWHFARNDGAISYRAQTRVLNEVASRLAGAELLHERTYCSDVDPTSQQHLNGIEGGLDGGEYICFNRNYINQAYTCTLPNSASPSTFSYTSLGIALLFGYLTISSLTRSF